jgi:hypothetical protein
MQQESCGNGGAMESVESQKQAFLSFHSSLGISPTTRDSHISTAPATRPYLSNDGKPQEEFASGWKSGNLKTGFPLSHRPDQPAAQGKNHFEQLKTKSRLHKTVDTARRLGTASLIVIWALHGLGTTHLFSVNPLRRVRGSIHRAVGA